MRKLKKNRAYQNTFERIGHFFKQRILITLKKWTSDEIYIRIRFFLQYKRFINLKEPVTFFAKINCLKLYDRNPAYTKLVDKYEVRNHIAEKIGSEYFIDLIGVYDSVEVINFDALPKSFVLKLTHSSDWVLLCKDQAIFDIASAKKPCVNG